MGNVSEFIAKVHTITFCLFSVFLIELALFIQSLSCYNWRRFNKRATGGRANTTLLALMDAHLPAICYNSGGVWKECAVCLTRVEDGEEIRELKCKHDFHKECLDQWLEREQVTCPLCRKYVLPEEVVFKHRQLRSRDEFNRDSLLSLRW
ncbi:brassinosteroid-responsive RING protein 1-like [Telopea speciosissima]|uniref:brassinosteroid-responsive RING protein 1-like n=1 Tax=Telopea speciosissima TaxID=54955 RepID=UPI001CC39D36|nr:brassinosteroid-responsive RING protein 1-like [Telopea speciosissima]